MKSTYRILAAIFGAAIALRVWGIDQTLFWYDESFTYLTARLPLDRLILATFGDVHPPLYYLLVKPFALLPWQPGGLRLFSVLCSLAGLVLIWFITGRYSLPAPARLLAVGIMAIWPAQIYYAQEARMYTLLQMLVLACWLAVLARRWKTAAAFGLAAMYTHLYGVFFAGAIGLAGTMSELMKTRDFYVPPRPPLRHEAQAEYTALWFGLALLAWLPWAAVIVFYQVPAISSGGGYWLDYMTPGSTIISTANVLITTQGTDLTNPFSLVLMAVGLPVLAWHAWRNKRLAMLLLGFGPALAAVAISLVWRPMYLNRALLPSMPALYILAAEWFTTTSRPRRWYALALVLPALAGAYVVWASTTTGGIRTMSVNYAGAVALDNLPVVHLDDSSVVIWKAARPDLRHYLLKNPCREEPGSLTEQTRAALGFEYIQSADLPAEYYTITVANIFATDCMLERNTAFTAGDRQVFDADLLYGDVGVYRHGHN